jgi:membrane protein
VAFYVILSLSPLVIVVLAITSWVFGDKAASGELFDQIKDLVGPQGAAAVEAMVKNASAPGEGTFAFIVGLGILIFSATGTFAQLQDALNSVFDVDNRARTGILAFIWDRMLSFAFVISLAFLLLVSLVLNAILEAVGGVFSNMMPGWAIMLQVINSLISFGMTWVLFAMIFKLLPDATLGWKDVWIGGLVTAILFLLGKFLIGLYLGNSAVASSYGAAGSLVVLLLWVYYSTLILFYGAEFTQVYAERFGSGLNQKKPEITTVPAEPRDPSRGPQPVLT